MDACSANSVANVQPINSVMPTAVLALIARFANGIQKVANCDTARPAVVAAAAATAAFAADLLSILLANAPCCQSL